MPYVSLDNLSQFWGNAKKYIDARDACYTNWQKTATAGAVTCCPVPESELHPVVNFSSTETIPAEGEKGPENPSTITGVESVKVTRCGKNLIQFFSSSYESTKSGITLTSNGDGSYTLNGTATAQVKFNLSFINLHAGTYMLSGCPSGGSESTFSLATAGGIRDYGSGATIILTRKLGRTPWIQIESGVTVSNLVFKPQLELGSTATAFEPYEGSDYTIQLGDTCYGGSLDVDTGVMTVTHEVIVFDGTEDWFLAAPASGQTVNLFYIWLGSINPHPYGNAVGADESCTHFPYKSAVIPNDSAIRGTRSFVYLSFDKESVADLKSWLAAQYAAGTPVVFVYGLETPATVQLTPTQIRSLPALDKYEPRINTVYTDQEAVQVGYQKSPIQTELELTDAILALGGGE